MAARISLRHLRCFVAVAETASFTIAAGRLAQTQSSLTSTIQQLEQSVGVKLFDRTTRRVELTHDAIWFKEVADKLLRDFDTALEDLRSVGKSQRGHMRIAAAHSVMEHVLAPTLSNFRQSYPAITITITDGASDKIEHAVLNGETDFALSSRLNDFPDLCYVPLLSDCFGVVFPHDHPLSQSRRPLKWSDLAPYDHVGLTEDTGIGALLSTRKDLGLQGWTTGDRASSTTSLYALLSLGGRIAVLPAMTAHSGRLVEFGFRVLREPEVSREICLIMRQQRSLSPLAQRFLEALLSTLKKSTLPEGSQLFESVQTTSLLSASDGKSFSDRLGACMNDVR